MARTCSLKGREAFSQLSSRHNLSAICVCPGIRLPSNMASHCNSLFSSTPSQDGNVRLGAYCDRKLSTQSSVRVWSCAVAEHRGSSAEEHFRSLKNGSHCQCGVFPMSLRSSEMGERSFPLYPFCHFTLVSPFHYTKLLHDYQHWYKLCLQGVTMVSTRQKSSKIPGCSKWGSAQIWQQWANK